MTQTDGDVALSGGFDLTTDMGFYAGTWASNQSLAANASMELDVYLGFAGEMAENMTYDVGYISVQYPGNDAADFEEAYIAFNIYGLNILYSDGQDSGPSYAELAYSIDVGPGTFNVSYGEYEDNGDNALVGYDWGVGGFDIGFYYYDYQGEAAADDDDGAYISIGRSF